MTYSTATHSPARFRARLSALAVIAALGLTACAPLGEPHPGDDDPVTLVVHNSFVDAKAFEKAASEATGYTVKVITAGDGGELTNKLVLTKGAPIADAFFGVDNTFASRLISNDVTQPITPTSLPARAARLAAEIAPGATALPLVPIDMGATCVNIDTAWFAAQGLAEPETFEDLADAKYKDLAVLIDPTASSTGASFMIATIAKFGENGFADYWKSLVANGARLAQGWSDAYYEEFTGGGNAGTRPIVLSYSTSPAFTVNEAGSESTTRALLGTCSTQVEYAGVLKGAKHAKGAEAVVNYLLSSEFQSSIPDEMYMYPVDEALLLPGSWATFAPLPAEGTTHDLAPAKIEAGLPGWLRTLGAAIGL